MSTFLSHLQRHSSRYPRKEYLIYAADRTSGFTPANVEQNLFPILDAFEMNALLVGMEHKGNTLEFTIRCTKGA